MIDRIRLKPGSQGSPTETLSLKDVIAITIGIVVGAGIFSTPSIVAANAGSETRVLLIWVAGGLITLIGALCYAELATSFPHSGGDYYYLTRAYCKPLAFLYAWSRIAVVQTGSIAMLAFVFGDYASKLFHFGNHSAAIYAALAVLLLTALNVAGVEYGSRTQNWLTLIEVLSLILVIVVGLVFTDVDPVASIKPQRQESPSRLGLALVYVLVTYGGWNEAVYVSAEVKNPQKNIARALLISIGVITGLYVLVNFAYLRGLGLQGLLSSKAVASDLMGVAEIGGGEWFVSVLVAVSTLTSANATVITGARTNYALGCDFRWFGFLGRWHERAHTPTNALIVQGAIALLLVIVASIGRKGFSSVIDYMAPVFWLFFFLVGLSLIILRRREPEVKRAFRVPLYPITPILFCVTCLYMFWSSLAYSGLRAIAGLIVLMLGVPVFLVTRRR